MEVIKEMVLKEVLDGTELVKIKVSTGNSLVKAKTVLTTAQAVADLAGGGEVGYLDYVAKLDFFGAVVTNLHHDTIGAPVFSRMSTGIYRLTKTDAFPLAKTWVNIPNAVYDGVAGAWLYIQPILHAGGDYIIFEVTDEATAYTDLNLGLFVEIRVYP